MMISPTCPACERDVAPEDVNVAKDVAYCRGCAQAFTLSERIHRCADAAAAHTTHATAPSGTGYAGYAPPATPEDDGATVPGLRVERTVDGVIISVRPRHLAKALYIGAFTVAWWALLSLFFSFFASATFSPALLAVMLFMAPFVFAGIALAVTTAYMLFGLLRITIDARHVHVYSGICGLGRRRRLPRAGITVHNGRGRSRVDRLDDQPMHMSAGEHSVTFGGGLTNEQRHALLHHLQRHQETLATTERLAASG